MVDAVDGTYHPANSSNAISARLEPVMPGESVRIVGKDGTVLSSVQLGDAKISSHVAGVPRRLELADGAVFVTPDHEALERATAELITHRRPWNIARLERPSVLLFVVGILTILGLLVGARFGIPLLAGPLAELTPPALTRAAGTGTLKSLDRIVLDPTELSEAQRARLTAGFDAIVRTNAINGEPKLHFRKSKTIGPNAFALMGGHIVVTDELVQFLKDDAQVIAIIAHELAHAKYLHPEQKVWRVAGTGLVLTLMFADAGTLVEELITLSYGVAELSNTREHEAEADRGAVEMMIKADMHPSALAEAMHAFKPLYKGNSDGGWLSTHPGLDERIVVICAMIPPGRSVRGVCR